MLAITLSLGVWQVERLAWKRGLLAEIDQGEQMSPIPLGTDPPAFRRVTLTGRFLPAFARYGIEVRSTAAGPAMGAHIVSPLRRPDGETVMVDRGWAPLDWQPPPAEGDTTLEGYVRPPEHPVRFGAADDPAARRFYALDPAAIGASLGLAQVAPFTLVRLGVPTGLPEPVQALPRPPNDHLSYAATWFGLSAVLVVIFLVYAGQVLRRRERSQA